MTTGFLAALKALFSKAGPPDDASPPEPEAPFGEPIVLPLEDSIDLHAFAPRDIPSVVEEYLGQCLENGLNEVRIIHGRGQGVQRRIVRSLLGRHSAVEHFKDAPPDRGGWGATVVTLRGGVKEGMGETGNRGKGEGGTGGAGDKEPGGQGD